MTLLHLLLGSDPLAWTLRSLPLLALALALDRRNWRASGAARTHLWRLTTLGCAAIVLATALRLHLPINVPLPSLDSPPLTSAGSTLDAVPAPPQKEVQTGTLEPHPLQVAPTVPTAIPPDRSVAIPPGTWIWLVWATGCSAVLVRWGRAVMRRRRFAAGAEALDASHPWQVAVRSFGGAPAGISILRHPANVVPCAWGYWRPSLLMPTAAEVWPEEQQLMALRHETAHLSHRDPVWQLLRTLVLAALWANPLVWLALRRARAAEEHAADDAVLRHTSPASYAALLLACSRNAIHNTHPTSVMNPHFSMPHPSTVPDRIRRSLDPATRRQPLSRPRTLGVIALMAVLTALCLTSAPADDNPSEQPAPAAPEPPKKQGSRGDAPVMEKLKSTVIDLHVDGTPFDEVIARLRKLSVDADSNTTDTEKKGINFILKVEPAVASKRIVIHLDKVPLGVALKGVCDLAGTRYFVEPWSVVISSPEERDELSTQAFRVRPDFALGSSPDDGTIGRFPARRDAMAVLKEVGVDFPPGATAYFDPANCLLTVRNTKWNLSLVSGHLETNASRPAKMINVRAELYRVPLTRALELSDAWTKKMDAKDAISALRKESGESAAKLVAAPMVQTRSGQRVVAQSGHSRRAEDVDKASGRDDASFEGCRLEVEPVLGQDGFTIDMAARIRYTTPSVGGKDRPIVGDLGVSATMWRDTTRLVGTLSGGDEADQTAILVFLIASVTTGE